MIIWGQPKETMLANFHAVKLVMSKTKLESLSTIISRVTDIPACAVEEALTFARVRGMVAFDKSHGSEFSYRLTN